MEEVRAEVALLKHKIVPDLRRDEEKLKDKLDEYSALHKRETDQLREAMEKLKADKAATQKSLGEKLTELADLKEQLESTNAQSKSGGKHVQDIEKELATLKSQCKEWEAMVEEQNTELLELKKQVKKPNATNFDEPPSPEMETSSPAPKEDEGKVY